jgi:transmembrane protein 33
MIVVARLELLILLRAVLGFFFRQNSLFVPIAFSHFLRSRYYSSAFTRDAVHTSSILLQGFVNRSGNPSLVRVYDVVKAAVIRWGSARVLEPQSAPGAPRR